MTYEQALEQVRHAIYGKDVREAIAYLFANTKDVDPSLKQNSTNAIQNGAVWEEFQKAYQKIEKVGAATKVDQSLSRYSENAIQNKSVWAEFQNTYLKIAQLGTTGVAGSVTIGLEDAAGDGITDDTDALNKALNHSNCVIDGGNRKYKYLSLWMENVENVTVRNVIFWKGQRLEVAGCKNIRFENCVWDGIYNNDDKTVWTCGIRLRERVDAAGNEIWCENIWIENCIFRDIWYNPYVNNGRPCDVTGIAILPRSVHNLYIRHNFFTQNKGNACIHWNSWKKNGYAEVTGNTFYLNAYGGVAVYAVQQQFPKVKGRVCNNQFIGCGLGYLPQEWFDMIPLPDNMLGQGCAGLLGGGGTQVAPKKWTFVCENNVFEDCVESSIEGPTWNPCIGNSITGQGAAQTEENCRKMEEKYHLDYKLKPRPIDSVNFIYRNYYADADGTFPNDDDDPIVFMNNTMGVAHVPRQSYIQFKGTYNVPFIFTGNVMRTGQPHIIDNLLLMRKNGVLKFYDFYMQTYGEVTGNDATAIFDGTLHIGENMAKPNESAKYKMRGKVYQCKVYNKALPTKLLEEMFPNIYSNESRIKGSITCYVNNLQYLVRIARCTYLEVTLDLGKHAWPEYAGKYPKAVGIKVTGLYGFDDVIWVGTGTDGHITKWIYNGGNMKPHEPITVTIANTGLCPGLEAKLIAFRCVNLTEDSKCVPATGIGVNWAGPLTIAAGGELKGEIVLTPAGANTMKDFKMEATGDSITASTSGTALIVRGISPGSATITVTHIGGAVYTCTINVT